MQVGDSVINNLDLFLHFETMLIRSIDSSNINGTYRKKYIIEDLNHNVNGVQIIEGIRNYSDWVWINMTILKPPMVFNKPGKWWGVYSFPGITCAHIAAPNQMIDDEHEKLIIYPSPYQKWGSYLFHK